MKNHIIARKTRNLTKLYAAHLNMLLLLDLSDKINNEHIKRLKSSPSVHQVLMGGGAML